MPNIKKLFLLFLLSALVFSGALTVSATSIRDTSNERIEIYHSVGFPRSDHARVLISRPFRDVRGESEINTFFSQLSESDYVADEILVKLKGDSRHQRIKVPSGSVPEFVKKFKARNDVESVEPNFIAHKFVVPNDPYYPLQWNFSNPTFGGINAPTAWNISTGAGVMVAVIDTGIAYEDYRASRKERYYLAPDLNGTCFAPGYDFVNNDSHANDDESHGTHVAGTIAQQTNNNLGVAGIAHNACLMPIKVLNKNGSGTYADIADGVRFAADRGAKVINLSLGGPFPSVTLEDALAYAYNAGVTIIAAAGNDGANSIGYPAAYDDYVIAVGATRFDETLSSYSNYGAALDIVAPGGDSTIDQNGDGYGDGILQNTFNPNTKNRNDFSYWFFQGTSMAAPHVAAVAALVIANGNATTPDEVRRALEESADDLGPSGLDPTYGHGLLNAWAALNWTAGPIDNPPTVSMTSPLDGAVISGTAIILSANATDDIGITEVNFAVDGITIATDSIAPYETTWDSTSATEGTHLISVTAVDTGLKTSIDTISVLIDNINDPPVADAGPDQEVQINTPVSFDGSASTDNDGVIVGYSWDFDASDGLQNDSSIATPNHTYTASGFYTATLTITDDRGASAVDTAVINVTAAPILVELFADSFEVGEWNGLWTEDRRNDWFRSNQRATEGSFSAEVDGRASDALLTSIPINLAGKMNATITFSWYIESSLDNGEYVAFDVSTNGGNTWIERARIRGNQDPEDTWLNISIDEVNIASLQLRFRGKMSGSSEDANVDNVRVLGW